MNIVVYCGSHTGTNPKFSKSATEIGKWIAYTGNTLVYGGSSVGLMGNVSRAALEGGADVIGVEPEYFIEAGVAQHDLTELIVVDTMEERKGKMIELGDVFIALPGAVGTLEEISEIMCRIRLDISPAPCYFLNIDGFYNPIKDLLKNMEDAGFMPDYNHSDYLFPADTNELFEMVNEHPVANREICSEAEWVRPNWMVG